jgi:hypothetical protein
LLSNDFNPEIMSWVALRTAARWEKKLAEALKSVGVSVFLPLMTRSSRYPGKVRSVDVPVFSGYLFCDRSGIVGNPRVPQSCRAKIAQILTPADPVLLRRELVSIAGFLTDNHLVQERIVGRPGDVVRISGGPLVGCEGVILRLKPNKWQVVLEVSFIGARIVAEVDDRLIEKVGFDIRDRVKV